MRIRQRLQIGLSKFSIKCNPTHPASFGLYGRIMADEGGYYNAMACFGINALLVGEKVKVLETALNEWENKNITPNSGPLTTLALNKVKEVLKSEPSKYGIRHIYYRNSSFMP